MKVLLCVCLALLGVVRGSDDLLGGAVQVARQHAEVFEAQLTKAGHGKVGQQMTRALQQGENCDLCQVRVCVFVNYHQKPRDVLHLQESQWPNITVLLSTLLDKRLK